MEKLKEDSLKLQREILPQVESAVQDYISALNKLKNDQQAKYQKEIDELNEKIDRVKIGIECDEAAISFIKSQMTQNTEDKENLACPKKALHSKVGKYREISNRYSTCLKFYEKRLGLSLKKLCDSTLWISYQYINERNDKEHSAVIKVEQGMYVLINCTPTLDKMQDLLDSLNKTNEFSTFLKDLRKMFQSLYSIQ